jgi:hypothetical protein
MRLSTRHGFVCRLSRLGHFQSIQQATGLVRANLAQIDDIRSPVRTRLLCQFHDHLLLVVGVSPQAPPGKPDMDNRFQRIMVKLF